MPDPLQTLLNFTPSRPLDPNGVDVYGELPNMVAALRANNRTARGNETGYALFDPGTGQTYHTGFTYGSDLHMAIPTPRGTKAVVHTHPPGSSVPTPSAQDLKSRVPNYVYSGRDLYVTDPRTGKFYKYDIDKWNSPAVNAFLAFRK